MKKIIIFTLLVIIITSCMKEGIIDDALNESIAIKLSNEEMLSVRDDVLQPLSENDILSLVENHNSSNMKSTATKKLSVEGKHSYR